MNEDRFEKLLKAAREEDPPDNGFTDSVMKRVAPTRSRSWRRFITRPTILAAATVMVGTAALAAIQTTTSRPAPQPSESSPVASKSPPARDEGRRQPPPESKRTHKEPRPSPSPAERSPSYGYTSQHTSYATNGRMRLETETFTNSINASQPHTVSVTLENITDNGVGVWGPKGCLVQVMAHPSESKTGPMWFCPDGSDPRAQRTMESEMIFVEPHTKKTFEFNIYLPEKGTWGLTGHCTCQDKEFRYPEEQKTVSPYPERTPLLGASAPPSKDPSYPRDPSYYQDARLVTPPIRMQAV